MKKILVLLLVGAIATTLYMIRRSGTPDIEIQTTIYGNVDIREVNLAFRQPGRLVKVYVEEGDEVQVADLLAELDESTFRDSLNIAKAQVALANAQLDELLAGYRSQEIDSARAEVKRAVAAADNAASQYKRLRKLADTGATSAITVDSAKAGRDESRAALAVAKSQLSMLEEGIRSQTINTARAQLQVAKAQLATAETAYADARLYAASDGVVNSRILEPGAMVGSSTPVLSVALRKPLYIRAYVGEATLGTIKQGQRVSFHTDSSSKEYHGHIGFISGVAEFTPKTVETTELRPDLVYRLRIVVDGVNKELNQGQPVTISLQLQEPKDGN